MLQNTFKIVLLLLFLSGIANSSIAQNKTIDSLLTLLKKDKEDAGKVKHLNLLSLKYQNSENYDSALMFSDAALQLASQLNLKKEIAFIRNSIGIINNETGNYKTALENYFIALKIRAEIGDKEGMAISYNNIGVAHVNQGNYKKSLENYLSALKIHEENHDKEQIATTCTNIGVIYTKQQNYKKALEILLVALEIEKQLKNKIGILDSYINIGNVYAELQKNSEAIENFQAALQLSQEIKNKKRIADSYANLGVLYYYQNNFDKSLANLFAALNLLNTLGNKKGLATSYNNIGNVYLAKSNYAEAINWFQKGIQLAKEIGTKEQLMDSYEGLSEANEKTNNSKSALKYYQLYTQTKDSIFNEISSKQLNELQIKYETEKKEKELETQAYQLAEQELLLSRNKMLLVLVSIASVLLLILIWILFSRYKFKKELQVKSEMIRHQETLTKAIIETQEQERKRIAQDLHDGIGHKLTTLKLNFEKIADDFTIASPDQKNIFEQTENILDETHKEVRTLSHTMMPKALQERDFIPAISDLVEQTLTHSKINYILNNDAPEELSSAIQLCLYRVLQELLNNILKHAKASEISIRIYSSKKNILMMVEDDGIGIENNNSGNGIGLHNIAGRVNAINGIFTVESAPVKGTIAIVRIAI